MSGKGVRTRKKEFTNKEAEKGKGLLFTKDTPIEEKLAKIGVYDWITADGSFGCALTGYMNKLSITEERLEEITQLSVRQISRLRNNRIKDVPLKTVVALCIGMRLAYCDSVILIGLAGYSLDKKSKEVQAYKELLLEVDISIEQCNRLLNENSFLPLTRKK